MLGGSSGLLAEYVEPVEELQTYLNVRFDRIERAIAVLSEDVQEQTEIVDDIRQSMALSVAIEIMDRARERRDGSNQGQVQAMARLRAEGFDFVGSDFSGVSLRGTLLDGMSFADGQLHFVDLTGASAVGARFRDSNLQLASADERTDFSNADLSRVRATLISAAGAVFQGS